MAAQYGHGGAVMADAKHFRLLKRGVDAWNDWIEKENEIPDLRHAGLDGAQLRGASLFGADLVAASLRGADLTHASLYRSDLRESDWTGASLRHTDLGGANLSFAVLKGADVTGAAVMGSWFVGVSVYGINGLGDVIHHSRSIVDIQTLENTAADVARDPTSQTDIERFLVGAGVHQDYIALFRQRVRVVGELLKSRGDRRLIESATVLLPPVGRQNLSGLQTVDSSSR